MYNGGAYIGSLLFDDRTYREQIGRTLETCTGRTIKEIGDQDFSTAVAGTTVVVSLPCH